MVEHLEKLPKISNFSLGLGKIKEKCMGMMDTNGKLAMAKTRLAMAMLRIRFLKMESWSPLKI